MDFRDDEKKKKKKRKLRGKEIYWGVWLGGFVRVKLVESICFLFGPTKMFSSQISEKTDPKILDKKLLVSSLRFLYRFFLLLFFSFTFRFLSFFLVYLFRFVCYYCVFLFSLFFVCLLNQTSFFFLVVVELTGSFHL